MASYYTIIKPHIQDSGRRPSTRTIIEECAELNIRLKHGDIINFGEDRQKYTYIYNAPLPSSDPDFIKNPDASGSGYLTIPLSITKTIKTKDTLKYYSKVIKKLGVEFGDIELSVDDKTILNIFKKEPSSLLLQKAKFAYIPHQGVMVVEMNGQMHYFEMLSVSLENIEAAFVQTQKTMKTKPSLLTRLKKAILRKK